MRRIIDLSRRIYFLSSAAVGGYEERRGEIGRSFDFCDDTDSFGMSSFEDSESEMGRLCLNIALKKASLPPSAMDVLLAGDLENQCVASSGGLYSFGIPYIGLYSACSTCTEALLLLSLLLSSTDMTHGATVTTSHNSAAERQFRTPLEYGAQRPPTAQWTATAAGSFVLSSERYGGKSVFIDRFMLGKIVDGLSPDGANMGASMARAAFDSVYTYFSLSGDSPTDYDLIVTGDLGRVGSDVLCDMLEREVRGAAERHIDCGNLLYSPDRKNLKAGASGCGCSAAVLAAYILPRLERGDIKNILFMSTGALMNPQSVMRGNNILGIVPVIRIRSAADPL